MVPLVAGVDTSTQSCKVVIRDADSGDLVREGRAAHPEGTECHPQEWWSAFEKAVAAGGGLSDVSAISVGGQQHGMVTLDVTGEVIRPALLWNDTRSAQSAKDLIAEGGGAKFWANEMGSVPVASFTVTKVRWLRDHEPEHANRVAALCLPHDWLSWKISGSTSLIDLFTDRSDVSGTGYWSPREAKYKPNLLQMALGNDALLPRVLSPAEIGAITISHDFIPEGVKIGPGGGDNAMAGLGVDAQPGDVVVSIGTSGTAFAVSDVAAADESGIVAGFADCTGKFLPLVCTLNAARIFDATAKMLGISLHELSDLALRASSGAAGAVVVPYFEGERTPNKPDSTGALHGLTLASSTPENIARAAFEGVLCGLADGVDALKAQGATVNRIVLVGGGAKSRALQLTAPEIFGVPVIVPPAGEYVADGAARQAAWVLNGTMPKWNLDGSEQFEADFQPLIREQYLLAKELTVHRSKQ